MARITLHSPHDPVTAAERLKAVVDEGLRPDSEKQVTGNGSDQSMTLWVHRPRFHNDFRTRLTATLEPARGGTRIEGRLGTPVAVRLFAIAWMGFVSMFLLVGIGVALLGLPGGVSLPFILIPLGMLAFGGLLFTLGGWHGREDREAILAFLARTIDAHPTIGTER